MPKFLAVKEAASVTGRSPSSIRRIIYPILSDEHHADRHHVEPSSEEAKELRTKGVPFGWRVSEELLARECGPAKALPRSATGKVQGDGSTRELIAMLQRELEIKNQQITQQMQLLNNFNEGLNERLREGNILIASLQQRLALSDGRHRDAAATNSVPAPSTSASAPTKPKPPKKSTARQGLFMRLFG